MLVTMSVAVFHIDGRFIWRAGLLVFLISIFLLLEFLLVFLFAAILLVFPFASILPAICFAAFLFAIRAFPFKLVYFSPESFGFSFKGGVCGCCNQVGRRTRCCKLSMLDVRQMQNKVCRDLFIGDSF